MSDPTKQEVFLRCPTCQARFGWTSQSIQRPSCSACQAWYPMGCHECGLDLGVDGFHALPLKECRADALPVCGLYCADCAGRYATFAVPDGDEKPCARCGAMVPAGDLRIRSQSESDLSGGMVSGQTVYEGVCPTCAGRADEGHDGVLKTFRTVGIVMAIAAVLLLLLNWLGQ